MSQSSGQPPRIVKKRILEDFHANILNFLYYEYFLLLRRFWCFLQQLTHMGKHTFRKSHDIGSQNSEMLNTTQENVVNSKEGGGLNAIFDSQTENFLSQRVQKQIQPKLNFVD